MRRPGLSFCGTEGSNPAPSSGESDELRGPADCAWARPPRGAGNRRRDRRVVIDLAGLGAPRIGVIPDAVSADAGERRVELGVVDKERVMPRTKLFARIEI